MFWALAIMGYKGRKSNLEKHMLSLPLVSISEGTKILPEDAKQLSRSLHSLPEDQRGYLLPRAIESALTRFHLPIVSNSLLKLSPKFVTQSMTDWMLSYQ